MAEPRIGDINHAAETDIEIMAARIEVLEARNQVLEGENARLEEENRRLEEEDRIQKERDEAQKKEIKRLKTENRSLQDLYTHDQLTKLSNRYGGKELIGKAAAKLGLPEGEKENRGEQGLTILLLDIDNFKSINDTYGHAIGDKVLESVAELLRSKKFSRTSDVVARWGGEEFLLAYPGANTQDIFYKFKNKAEGTSQISLDVDIEVEIEEGEKVAKTVKIKVTLSGGVTEYRAGESLEKVIDRADKLLAEVKESGKNRITMQGEPGNGK